METGKVVEDTFREAFLCNIEPCDEKYRLLKKDREDRVKVLRKLGEEEESFKKEIRKLEDDLEDVEGVGVVVEECKKQLITVFGQIWTDEQKELVEKKIEVAKKRLDRFEEVLGLKAKVEGDFITIEFIKGGFICIGTKPDFWVEKLEPQVDGIQEMVNVLNETEDLPRFLKSLSDQFEYL